MREPVSSRPRRPSRPGGSTPTCSGAPRTASRPRPACSGASSTSRPSRTTSRSRRGSASACRPSRASGCAPPIAARATCRCRSPSSPVTTVGLVPNVLPVSLGGRTDTLALRWDAEWSPHVFTAVEYQRQRVDNLELPVADTFDTLAMDKARVDRVSATANVWLGGGFGLFGTVGMADAHVDSRRQPRRGRAVRPRPLRPGRRDLRPSEPPEDHGGRDLFRRSQGQPARDEARRLLDHRRARSPGRPPTAACCSASRC